MITIHLRQLAQQRGKTISDIARETGLNRNTITALYHQKVDGIKFETIEKICQTYGVSLNDLISHKEDIRPAVMGARYYKQEGEATPFTILPPGLAVGRMPKEFFAPFVHEVYLYCRKGYIWAYWSESECRQLAEWICQTYSKNHQEFEKIFYIYQTQSNQVDQIYRQTFHHDLASYSKQEVIDLFWRTCESIINFWKYSIFIDVFDSGTDQQFIQELMDKYGFSREESSVLMTPVEMTYNNERLLMLLGIIELALAKDKKLLKNKIALQEFLESQPIYEQYRENFDYFQSNYAVVNHIDTEQTANEMMVIYSDKGAYKQRYQELKNYASNQQAQVKKILAKYGLAENPFWLFQKLTFWREHRKQSNLMGVHVLHKILAYVEIKTGIPQKLLHSATQNEFEALLSGLIKRDVLEERYEKGVIFHVLDGDLRVAVSHEAQSLKDELDLKSRGEITENTLTGQVASQGYAQVIARVVLGTEDFSKFNEGEILVTGMTRPEFVPLMKKSAAIVTNEGGVTCHAAIVSRELAKPCIIGTRNATDLIHDGDLIEVRANHGTVRILKRA